MRLQVAADTGTAVVVRGQGSWCAGAVAELCGGAYSTLAGGFSDILGAGVGYNTPIGMEIYKNVAAGNWEMRWFGLAGAMQITSTPKTLPVATFGADPDSVCFYMYVPNGNYYPTFLLLGYDQSS